MRKSLVRSTFIAFSFFTAVLLNSSHESHAQDIVGKVITGYQGWFNCEGDSSPIGTWIHWGEGAKQPKPGSLKFELYPDMREYTTTYQTGFANLGNGQAATLFSSYDDQVVDKHFQWMSESGIDCAALQRFGNAYGSSTKMGHKNGIALKVKKAAETHGIKFYMMYDLSSWTNFQNEIKLDWTNTLAGSLNLLSSPAYAKEDGKPVVCLWGVASAGRPGEVNSWKEVIEWFKEQGCYVIAGGNKDWRTDPINLPAWQAADMISPWHVGTFSISSVDSWGNKIKEDMNYCKKMGIDYMPVLWPGFAWSNWKEGYQDKRNHHPRMHGEFMWNQFHTAKSKFDEVGSTATTYIAMFDEFDEGTAIAKAAEDISMIPTDQYFLTLDADGVRCSSDFYLRLVTDGGKMMKGLIPLTTLHPTLHILEQKID